MQEDVYKVVYYSAAESNKRWKQPNCPSLDCYTRGLYKLWFSHKMKCRNTIKMDELDKHVSVSINPRKIRLSRKMLPKDTYNMMIALM